MKKKKKRLKRRHCKGNTMSSDESYSYSDDEDSEEDSDDEDSDDEDSDSSLEGEIENSEKENKSDEGEENSARMVLLPQLPVGLDARRRISHMDDVFYRLLSLYPRPKPVEPDPFLMEQIQNLEKELKDAEDREEKESERLRKARSKKALLFLQNRTLHQAFAKWKDVLRIKHLLKRVAGRFRNRRKAGIFESWRRYVQDARFEREVQAKREKEEQLSALQGTLQQQQEEYMRKLQEADAANKLAEQRAREVHERAEEHAGKTAAMHPPDIAA